MFLKQGILFLCGGVFSSCSFFKDVPEPPVSLGGEANFIVSEVEGKVVETKANGLPEEIRIAYKACFKDQSYQDNALQNSFFNVHFFESPPPSPSEKTRKCEEGKEEVVFKKPPAQNQNCLRIRTDASGCFNWTEIYPVKSFSKSRWLAYERGFEGTELYHGMRSIPLAVNPWLSLDPSGSAASLQLMDLRYHQIGENSQEDKSSKSASSSEDLLFAQLTNKDIEGCKTCPEQNPTSSAKPTSLRCAQCEYKTKSLSRVMDRFHSQKPRLWLNHLSSNINQEHINLQNPTVQHQQILKQLQVCYGGKTQDCDPAGRFFKVQLEMPLRIKATNYRKETDLLPLKRGEYSLAARLYLSGDKGQKQWQLHRDVLGVLASPAAGSKESHFRSVFYLHLPYEHYGLAASLSLAVKSTDDKFKQFEGVFHFPEFLSTVRGKNTLNLAKRVEDFYDKPSNGDRSFILSEMDMSSALLDKPLLREQLGFRSAGWDVQLKRLRFSDILMDEGKCPTPVSRHIRYVGEACVVDPLTGEPVSNTQVKIVRQDVEFQKGGQGAVLSSRGQTISPPPSLKWSHFVEGVDESYIHHPDSQNNFSFSPSDQKQEGPYHWSNTQGCVQWVDTMEHQWYDRERYFVRRMVFSKEEWGFEGEKIIAINPWHYGFVFFQDITQLGLSSVRTRTEHVEKPQLALHDFRSLFVEPVYTVDRSLGIHIFQNLLFLFKVMVQRPDDVATGQGGKRPSARPLRRGYYLLRFILMKSHTDEGGGAGNQVHHHGEFVKQYQNSLKLGWNELNRGWTLGKTNPAHTGQMMNTTFDYITHFDTYVQVRDGTVNAYINFLFDMEQFAFIGSNSRVIVELLPTDPEHYVYKEGSCEVDPQASRFVPLNRSKHDLISKPFFGSFVPKDLRNWNIFRVVDTEESKMYRSMPFLSLDHEGTDDLIAKSREQLKDKTEFFKSFHRGLNVRVSGWSPFSRVQIQQEGMVRQWEDLYRQMWAFQKSFELLKTGNRGGAFVLHHQKHKLMELIDKTSQFMDEVISRGANPEQEDQEAFFRINSFLKQLRKEMESGDMSFERIQKATQNMRDLLSGFSPVKRVQPPFGFLNPDTPQVEEKQPLPDSSLQLCAKGAEGENKNSTRRLCEFSAHEALKPVLMDSQEDKNKFLEDLAEIARKYRDYKNIYLPFVPAREEFPPPLYSQKEKTEWIQSSLLKTAEERKNFVSEVKNQNKKWESRFPFYEDDSELNFISKHYRMHLYPLSEEEVNQVIAGGVHKGNIDTHEVSQFLHLMCGFWFDKFYDKYLDFRQVQTIFDKHKDHLNYYLGTGEQWLQSYAKDILNGKNVPEGGFSPVDYGNLLSVMEAQGLVPPDESGLKSINPFYYPRMSKLGGVMEFAYSNVQRRKALVSDPMGLFLIWDQMYTYRHPYFKCLNNPLNFFHIEKKVIVGDIGTGYSDLKYNYGESRRLAMQTSFDFSYALNWSMSKSFSASLGSGFTALGGLDVFNPLQLVKPVFVWNGLKMGGDWSSGASTQESSRRQQTLRFAQPIELAVSHSSLSIRLKEFRHCLVIRPQNLAFQEYQGKHHIFKPEYKDNVTAQLPYIKSGLLLCSRSQSKDQRDEDFSIVEDYFYIYQPAQGDPSEFLRHLSMRNRPYILTVRGVTDYEKLMFLMRSFVEADREEGTEDSDPEGPMTSQWKKNSRVFDGTRRAIRQAKMWDKTGFYPGVYHVRPDNEHFYFKSPVIPQSRGRLQTLGEYMHRNNILPWIPFDDQESVLK